jgi:hypothetical protein
MNALLSILFHFFQFADIQKRYQRVPIQFSKYRIHIDTTKDKQILTGFCGDLLELTRYGIGFVKFK